MVFDFYVFSAVFGSLLIFFFHLSLEFGFVFLSWIHPGMFTSLFLWNWRLVRFGVFLVFQLISLKFYNLSFPVWKLGLLVPYALWLTSRAHSSSPSYTRYLNQDMDYVHIKSTDLVTQIPGCEPVNKPLFRQFRKMRMSCLKAAQSYDFRKFNREVGPLITILPKTILDSL